MAISRQIRKDLDEHARRMITYASSLEARNMRPRDAAALIVLDRGRRPRVLMGRRHTGHVFLPGVFVFPGGRVEPQDYLSPAAGPGFDCDIADKLMAGMGERPSLSRAKALGKAAFREAYEEAGVVFAPLTAGAEAAASFPPAPLHLLSYIARAITPPFQKRRFDTRFFAVEARHIVMQHQGDGELLELCWLSFDEARAKQTPPITRAVLEEAEKRLESGELFHHRRGVPTYCKRGVHFHRRFI